MKLRWEFGEEAICPVCRHCNACLGDYRGVFTCRDCHRVYRVTGSYEKVGTDTVLGRPIVEAECEEVNSK